MLIILYKETMKGRIIIQRRGIHWETVNETGNVTRGGVERCQMFSLVPIMLQGRPWLLTYQYFLSLFPTLKSQLPRD